jgi:hypothetical protein
MRTAPTAIQGPWWFDGGPGQATPRPVTDGSLAPFERHPASPEQLAMLADRLARLADRGIDLTAVAEARVGPAEASWDGLAAAELRAAPEPVRDRARATIGALAWASGPVRYWSEQVRLFNARVEGIMQLREQARIARWGIPAGDALAHEREWARAEHDKQLRDRWWQAHQQFIDEGARTTAAMLRDGPTADHLSALAAGRVWQRPTGAVAGFLPEWHEQAMRRLAGELAGLAGRITDPGHRPTERELTRLEQALAGYAADPVFAHHLLAALGPAGLLALTGSVALLQIHGHGPLDDELARLVGTIQAGLGVALATATARRGTGGTGGHDRYRPAARQLPESWVNELVRHGRERFFLSMPLPEPGQTAFAEVYGHQLLGVLLQSPSAEFDRHLLNWVGSDLLQFETQAGWSVRGEGVPIWVDTRTQVGWSAIPVDDVPVWMDRQSAADVIPVQLNWVVGGAGNDGYDPLVALMSALARDADAAREFFTATVSETGRAAEGAPQTRLPRVDYLLTDRAWPADQTFAPPAAAGRAGPGQLLLAEALVEATTTDPDQRSHRIVESIIYELATDEQALGYPNNPVGDTGQGVQAALFRDNDLIPDGMREPIAEIAAFYIDDLFWNLAGSAQPEGVPGDHDVAAAPRHTEILLAELGKQPQSRDVVTSATVVYTGMVFDHYLSGNDQDWGDRLATAELWAGRPAGLVLGTLDFGYGSALASGQQQLDADANQQVHYQFLLPELAADVVSESRVPLVVGNVVKEALERMEAAAQADRTGDVNYQVGDLRQQGRELLRAVTDAAVHRNLTPAQVADLPDALFHEENRGSGLIPISEWERRHRDAWEAHVGLPGAGLGPVAGVDQRYEDGYARAREDLEGYS